MLKKKGKIIKWDDAKGFGFILPQDSKKHIFVHIKSFANKSIRPSVNQDVIYTILKDKDGKNSAINVTRATDNVLNNKQNNTNKKNFSLRSVSSQNSNFKIDYKSTHNIGIFSMMFILSFLVFLLYSFINDKLPLSIIIFYSIIGAITYFAYSSDKSKAIDKEYRTSEKSLLILSLIGGWIGAIIAQQRFRHKTKKSSFQIPFWITVLLNISILIYEFKLF